MSDAASLTLRNLGISALAPDTLIETEEGPLPLEWVVQGHRILTRDDGLQEVYWTAATRPDELGEAGRPVLIPEGALAPGVPWEPVLVAPRHRILIRHPAVELYFGAREAFVEARDLLGLRGIGPAHYGPDFAYVHLALAQPAVIETAGLCGATLGVAGEQAPHPVLDAGEARLLRSTLDIPVAAGMRRIA